LKYVDSTLDIGLCFKKKSISSLVGFTNVDLDGDLDYRRFNSGYVFLNGSTSIYWRSKK